MSELSISVIICTFNPRPDLFRRVLEALARQTLDAGRWRLIIVDNNSNPAISSRSVEEMFGRPVTLVRETTQGLAYARAAGIAAAQDALICFVDDDNIIHENYLEAALQIAASEPDLGVFGGRALAVPEKKVGEEFAAFFPYFGVNEHGDQPLTGPGGRLGAWTPIGAGLCVRREIADAYCAYIKEQSAHAMLGRRGGILMSGEDTLFSALCGKAGRDVGYRPSLSLDHVIAKERLTHAYLAKLMEGHGQSRVLLSAMMDVGEEDDPLAATRRAIAINALRRLKGHGPMRAFGMLFWDIGRRRALAAAERTG